VSVQLRGFSELERALTDELPKATSKNILRRTALNAMKPIEERAKELAPKDDGTLAASITTKVVKAKRVSRTKFASSGVTVATGPTGRPEGGNAAWQEFGTVKQAAQPYMRPAGDYESDAALDIIRDELAAQINKARKRIARKAAKGK
jgi:HK97 gp10 family phage protein